MNEGKNIRYFQQDFQDGCNYFTLILSELSLSMYSISRFCKTISQIVQVKCVVEYWNEMLSVLWSYTLDTNCYKNLSVPTNAQF